MPDFADNEIAAMGACVAALAELGTLTEQQRVVAYLAVRYGITAAEQLPASPMRAAVPGA